MNSVREIYVFPYDIVLENIKGKSGTNSNPKNIIGGCEKYRDAYSYIKQICT